MDPTPEGAPITTERLQELLRVVEPLQPTMSRTLRWQGEYDMVPGTQESVATHQEDMNAYAKYLFEGFPFEGLTEEVKLQILLINMIHDLDEWKDGDTSIREQEKMTVEELERRSQNKKMSFDRLAQSHNFPGEIRAIYDAFEHRHDIHHTRPSWISPIALAYSGLLDRTQGVVFKTFYSTQPKNEDIDSSLSRIAREFDLLSQFLPITPENTFQLIQLKDHVDKLVSTGIFDRGAVFQSEKDDSEKDSHVPYIIRGEKQLADFTEGARSLVAMERATNTVVVGQDIPVVIEGKGRQERMHQHR